MADSKSDPDLEYWRVNIRGCSTRSSATALKIGEFRKPHLAELCDPSASDERKGRYFPTPDVNSRRPALVDVHI